MNDYESQKSYPGINDALSDGCWSERSPETTSTGPHEHMVSSAVELCIECRGCRSEQEARWIAI